jgi:hypothetical protein
MPRRDGLTGGGYYNVTPECWSVYTEVLEKEYANGVLFGQVHQLTVDAYAVHHAGGPHPDKSVDVHLVGLHLVIERGFPPPNVPKHLQQLASRITSWPHFPPPAMPQSITVFDVAMADSPEQHAARVREWSAAVWSAWAPVHRAVAELAGE